MFAPGKDNSEDPGPGLEEHPAGTQLEALPVHRCLGFFLQQTPLAGKWSSGGVAPTKSEI